MSNDLRKVRVIIVMGMIDKVHVMSCKVLLTIDSGSILKAFFVVTLLNTISKKVPFSSYINYRIKLNFSIELLQ